MDSEPHGTNISWIADPRRRSELRATWHEYRLDQGRVGRGVMICEPLGRSIHWVAGVWGRCCWLIPDVGGSGVPGEMTGVGRGTIL